MQLFSFITILGTFAFNHYKVTLYNWCEGDGKFLMMKGLLILIVFVELVSLI